MLKNNRSSEILFQNNNNKIILLIHCFRSSPVILYELSQILFNNGFSVYNLRLPGHGFENEEKIFEVNFKDWINYAEHIFLDLSDRFNKIYMGGLSLGGTVVLELCEKYNNVNKLLLFSPLLKVRQRWAFMAGVLKLFKNKMIPSEADCSIKTEINKEFISFFPVSQGYEAYKLSNIVRKKLYKIKTETLCFLSVNDHDINYRDHLLILKKYNYIKIITLEKSFHLNIIDIEKDFIFEKILKWLN